MKIKDPKDIILHCKDGQLQRVSELHRSYDPLQYPLMFVKGEDSYYLTIQKTKQFPVYKLYAYRLMVKNKSFNTSHHYRDKFSKYCVDMIAKMISERLHLHKDYIPKPTKVQS